MKNTDKNSNFSIYISNYGTNFDLILNDTLNKRITDFEKYTIFSTKKIAEKNFTKLLKSNQMLRNLFVHNILKFENGNIQFCLYRTHELNYNLNNFFFILEECGNCNFFDPVFISSILTKCWKLYDDETYSDYNSMQSKLACLEKKQLGISYKNLLIYYILLNNEEKESFNNAINELLNFEKVDRLSVSKNVGANTSYSERKNKWLNQNADVLPERRKENPYRLSFEDIQNLKCEIDNTHIYKTTFAQDVLEYCYRQGIFRGVDFERETYVSQNEFSKLFNNETHIPEKRIAISICVGLRLTYNESVELLSKAGYTLSTQIPFDRFITENSLTPRFYDIETLNYELKKENIRERLGTMPRGIYNKTKSKNEHTQFE